MAIIAGGKIVKSGAPGELVKSLDGRIWIKTVDKADLAALREQHQVISTRLFGGRTVAHVLADADPGDGFKPFAGGLEDVYFSTLHASRQAPATLSGLSTMFAEDRRFRVPLSAEEPGVLGGGGDLLPLDLRVGDHQTRCRSPSAPAPTSTSIRPMRWLQTSLALLTVLHVRLHRLRRQRGGARRRDRLRPDRPRHAGEQGGLPCSAASSALSWRSALAFMAVPLATLIGTLGALGGPGEDRPVPAGRLPLHLLRHGAAEPVPDLSGLLRPGHRHPLDDGDLCGRGRGAW